MTTKLSITMPDETAERARSAAERAGKPLEAWIVDAVERQAYRERLAHDAAIIKKHGLLGPEREARRLAAVRTLHAQAAAE